MLSDVVLDLQLSSRSRGFPAIFRRQPKGDNRTVEPGHIGGLQEFHLKLEHEYTISGSHEDEIGIPFVNLLDGSLLAVRNIPRRFIEKIVAISHADDYELDCLIIVRQLVWCKSFAMTAPVGTYSVAKGTKETAGGGGSSADIAKGVTAVRPSDTPSSMCFMN